MKKKVLAVTICSLLIIFGIFIVPKTIRFFLRERKVFFLKQQIVENQRSTQKLQTGDIIFQTSKSAQSKAIQLATKSEYSHCGIIVEQNGQLSVLEAVQPVKYTQVEKWILRGENEHFVVKRLKNANQFWTKETIENLNNKAKKYLGKNYDIYFEWSDEKMYCSELIWKLFKEVLNIEVGELQHLSDFDLSNETVKAKIKERYGNTIPMNEIVISPVSIYNSDKLETFLTK